jgi:hypothetical protein
MPRPCCAHAFPLPCLAAKGLECVFPIWFTRCSRVWFTLAMPRPCHPRPCRCSQGHDTARPSRDYLFAFGFFRLPCGVPRNCNQMHTDLRCRWPVWNQTPFAWTRKRVVAAHYKKDSVGLAVRIFPATMRTLTKDTALSKQGRSAAWHVWITHGMAGEGHENGMGALCYVWIGLIGPMHKAYQTSWFIMFRNSSFLHVLCSYFKQHSQMHSTQNNCNSL